MAPREGLPGLDSSLTFSAEPLDHLFLVFHGAGDPYIDHPPWLQSLETSLSKLQTNYDLMRSTLQKFYQRIPIIDSSTTATATRNDDSNANDNGKNEDGSGNDEKSSSSIVATGKNEPRLPTALFLPVEWHRSAFETWQSEIRIGDPRPKSTNTSATIPNNNNNHGTMVTTVREALSDTLGDIIMMSSPFWRESIAKYVSKQIESQIAAVFRNRPAFSGRISILCHSVGSIIALELIYQNLLSIDIDALFMTGCPIPTYAVLSPDNQHCLSTIRKYQSKIRFINVFHPLDPVAYRLEPFIVSDLNNLLPPVKVASRKRTFWQDAELFWDDVVYNLWSSLFPRRNPQIKLDEVHNNENDQSNRDDNGNDDNGKNQNLQEDFMGNLLSSLGGNNNNSGSGSNIKQRPLSSQPPQAQFSQRNINRKRALRRSSSYVFHSEADDGGEQLVDDSGGEVLLSGRVDYELQDGMGVPPIDVMASWGAIKAHTYYWQSLDVTQMLLDIAMTSETALSLRR